MTLPSNTRDSHPRLFVDDVWYIIISILHPEHCGENEGDKSPDYWKAKEPSKHPPDLGDLLSLSSTCTYFRDLLGPRIFETLYLRNTRKSALSVQAVADGRFSVCVKVLRFIGTYRVSSSLDELCLPEVINVLSNLTRFGSLQHLSIRFPFDDDDISGPHSMEREVKWRSLIALSFFAVVDSYQSSPPPRSLEMQDLNIIAIPTITPPKSWTVFRQLKALNVTLQSPSEGLRRNVIKSIKAFQVDFDYSIFNNLRSVEELTFNPFDAIHMGQVEEELRYTHDIGLGSARMPSLRKVTFANIFICGELCNFLLRHLGTLDQSPSGIATPTHSTTRREPNFKRIPWQNLFLALAYSNPKKLTNFEVINPQDQLDLRDPDSIWLTEEAGDEEDGDWDGPELVEKAYRKRESEPDVMLFSHYEVGQKSGKRMRDSYANVQSYVDGDDWTAYTMLMAVVEGNKDRENTTLLHDEWG